VAVTHSQHRDLCSGQRAILEACKRNRHAWRAVSSYGLVSSLRRCGEATVYMAVAAWALTLTIQAL
jgi:hypothetical protein